MKLIFTKEKTWLDKWDAFVSNNPRGSYIIRSEWLKSYKPYGFDYEVGLSIENNEIVGGYGAVIAKFLWFKFYIIPHGPIYEDKNINYLIDHLVLVKKHAKKIGACYMQFSMPISDNEKILDFVYRKEVTNYLKTRFVQGKKFSHVYSTYGLNWIDIRKFGNSDLFLEHLTTKVRRNIRIPYNKNATISFVNDINMIEKGYEVISQNARDGNYSVRSFDDFKQTILELIDKRKGYFIICEVEGVIKAAGFFVLNYGYITNITGGVLRHKPDVKLGYMIQWEMIKKSFELGLQGYNISMGGSAGVQNFKSKFGAQTIAFEESHYHLVLNNFWFSIYRKFEKIIKPFKRQISKLLAFFGN